MPSEDIAWLLKQASLAQRAGDKAGAIAHLQKVVAQQPQHEAAWVWLGGLLTDPVQAMICLQKALAINPNNEQAKQGLAWWQNRLAAQSAELRAGRRMQHAEQMMQEGKPVEAIEAYRLVVTLAPNLVEGWLGLGAACQQVGWSNDAALAYRQALALNPQQPAAQQALQALAAPPVKPGAIMWSMDLIQNEAGNWGSSSDGQRLLVSSGGVTSLAAGESTGRQSGFIHLIDRCGNSQVISTNWKIWHAGLADTSALVYASQAARANALVVWLDPADPATPVMQHLLQGGPPSIWKCANDVLVVASPTDPFTAIEPDGAIRWRAMRDPCDSLKLQPAQNGQAALVLAETLRTFSSYFEASWLTNQGQIAWRREYPHRLSALIIESGARVLLTTDKLVEALDPQGVVVWSKPFRDITLTQLSPAQKIVAVLYQQASALECLDAWTGQALWQKTGLSINSASFVSFTPAAMVILRDRTLLEALDAQHGATLWQVNLSQYGQEPGQVIDCGSDWLAVTVGQTLVTVSKTGRVLGKTRVAARDLAARQAPPPPAALPGSQGKGIIVTESGRRMLLLDQAARAVWEQNVLCEQWWVIPHSPYLAALGRKTSDRYTLSMLRWR